MEQQSLPAKETEWWAEKGTHVAVGELKHELYICQYPIIRGRNRYDDPSWSRVFLGPKLESYRVNLVGVTSGNSL